MAKKRIGILTGGGDVPGLNAVIKTVTYRGSENDIEVVGFRRGWEALTHLNLEDPASRRRYVIALDREQHAHHRPARWHHAALEPHQPGQDAEAARSPRRQGLSGLPE